MKVTIQNIKFSDSNKEGQAYLDMNSRPQTRVSMLTAEHGKKWLSSFAYQGSEVFSWKAGEVHDVEIKTKGDFINFSLPKEPHQVSNSGLTPKGMMVNQATIQAMNEELITALRRIDLRTGDIIEYLDRIDGKLNIIGKYLGIDAGQIARTPMVDDSTKIGIERANAELNKLPLL
jgi:hypothetical protein